METYRCRKFRGSEVSCYQCSQCNDLRHSRKRYGMGCCIVNLKRRTVAGGHITNVPTLIVKRAGIRSSSKDRHTRITFPVHLASVPKLGNCEIISLQNVKPLVLCWMPLHPIAEDKRHYNSKKRKVDTHMQLSECTWLNSNIRHCDPRRNLEGC
jgi:hypothetical protein